MNNRTLFKNMLLKSNSIELLGKDIFQNNICILRKYFFFFMFPLHVIKLKKIRDFKKKSNKNIISNGETTKKIMFRFDSRIKKNTIFSLEFKYNYEQLKLEIQIGKKFLFILNEPRIKEIFIGPFNFLITLSFNIIGQGKLISLNNEIESNVAFDRCNFYVTRIYPYYIKKKINVLNGLKLIDHMDIKPSIITTASSRTGLSFWFFKWQKFNKFELSQICCLKIFKVEKIKVMFKSINCSIYLSITNHSILSSYRILIDYKKNFLKVEKLGVIDDSLLLSMTDFCWGSEWYNYIVGGFNDGKFLIWNEMLFPLIQIINSNFSIIRFNQNNKPSNWVFILKKNYLIAKDIGKKKFLKSLPQTILLELEMSKSKRTKTLNSQWFLFHVENIKVQDQSCNFTNQKFTAFFDKNIFFYKFNRYALCLAEKIISESMMPKIFSKFYNSKTRQQKELYLEFSKKNRLISLKFKSILNIIGKKRYFTRKEISSEQLFLGFKYPKINFKKCQACSRNWKILDNVSKTYFCPFNHYFGDSNLFEKFCIYSKNLKNLYAKLFTKKITNEKSQLFKIFPTSSFNKFNFLQKEINWCKLFENATRASNIYFRYFEVKSNYNCF